VTQVIVLNGGSSSGKSSIARALQDVLPGLWLTFGTDVLAEALPRRGDDPRSGLVLEPDGTVTVKPEFRAVEKIWYEGLAIMANRGALLILDEVFLAGGAGQQRLRAPLGSWTCCGQGFIAIRWWLPTANWLAPTGSGAWR
jgi:chloramphenicol 3-O phosphotransferase